MSDSGVEIAWDEDSGCPVGVRPRCLCGKARYATEKEAGRAVKRIRRIGKDRRKRGEWLIPYMCPERKGIWHVGHTDE